MKYRTALAIRHLSTAIMILFILALAFRLFPIPDWVASVQRRAAEVLGQTRQAARLFPLSPTSLPPTLPPPAESDIAGSIQAGRESAQLAPLEENTTLHKLARLLALEIEDQGTLEQPANTKEILQALSPTVPKQLDTLFLFVQSGVALEPDAFSSHSAVLNSIYRQFGVATRSATLSETEGTLIVVALSTPFQREVVPAAQPRSVRPSFTGQDLWQAVQNYRQAHALPAFEMSSELCTVASIRVNELLELGKLDNHDGFQPRADEFFENNPGWSAINENLAAGYQTAVQTVEWGWDQSLGHQALIQSREFPKACTAANSGFAVLITGK